MKHEDQRSLRSKAGFTLIEVIIVVIIMASLAAISIPSFMGWRQNLKYRETAREVASMLREAKSRAITNNREQQVQFDVINQKYGMRPGNRAYSTNWSDASIPLVTNWTILDGQVKISGAPSIEFTPNGVACAVGTVSIQDISGVTRFSVNVSQTGRISITQGS